MDIKVAILMGSDSDLPVMKKAAQIMENFDIPFEVHVMSAHRTPEYTVSYIQKAYKNGLKVIIAGAGGAAHLAGVAAAHFPLVVIGVPVKGKSLEGADSLYSTVQMPPGIPVATVGIDNAKNAGLLAVKVLATNNTELEKKIVEYTAKQSESVMEKDSRLQEKGYKDY